MIANEVWGRWKSAHESSTKVKAVDYRAGHLMTVDSSGQFTFGHPDEFISEAGLSGAGLMERLLPSPTVADLLHGCLRETLANAASAARIGRQETRDFDGPETYFADDNEGCVTCISFVGPECIGLGFSDDPSRTYDYQTVISAMPSPLQKRAKEVAKWPFFCGASTTLHGSFLVCRRRGC